jgi:DNA-nicking Smr family endonuclease
VKKHNKKPETDATHEDDEMSLFRDSMRDVKPLTIPDKVVHARKHTPPVPHHIQQNEQSTPEDSLSDHISLEIAAGDEWSFLRPGLSRQTLRRLRRGHWRIQAHLDLHGFTRDEARLELTTFLDSSSKNNFRCVRVIHGRGLGSRNREPVLKISIGNWLVQRNDVLAFCQAKPEDGGSGAVLILLKVSAKQ